MRRYGKDVHRVSFIAYFGGGQTMIAETRDASTLAAWARTMGLNSVEREGVYRREDGDWVWDRGLRETSTRRPGVKRDAVRTVPDRQAILQAIASSGAIGIHRLSLVAILKERSPETSADALSRKTSNYLRRFRDLNLVTVRMRGRKAMYFPSPDLLP